MKMILQIGNLTWQKKELNSIKKSTEIIQPEQQRERRLKENEH